MKSDVNFIVLIKKGCFGFVYIENLGIGLIGIIVYLVYDENLDGNYDDDW